MKFIEDFKLIKRGTAMQSELIQALAYMRNMVILGRGKNISAELLMEELADMSDVLKRAFQDIGHYLHVNDKETAAMVLYKYMDTGISKDLGRFLAGWDDVPPQQLKGTIEIYLDNLRQDSLDQKKRRDEVFSDLIYFPVVLNAMLVLLDFVYVAFYIEQQDMLKTLFF